MNVYTLNLRVFWPVFTCVLTGLVVLHHISHRRSPELSPDSGNELGAEGCSQPSRLVLILSLTKLLLAIALCLLFIRYCSSQPGRPAKSNLELTDSLPKSNASRHELLEDYYNRWVRLSPHVVGHSKANVAKLVGDLVRAGRANVPPDSSLAFRGDFLQVGSSYEEHKVGSPDCFDILVPLRVPQGLKLDPRLLMGKEMVDGKRAQGNGRKKEAGEREGRKGEVKMASAREARRRQSKRHKGGPRFEGEKKEETKVEEKEDDGENDLMLRKEEDGKEEQEDSAPVLKCSLEVPPNEEWVHKHRPFADTFLRLHPQRPVGKSSVGLRSRTCRLSPKSVLCWFYSAVQRCLETVRYPYEQCCTLILTPSNQNVQLHLTPRSDHVCCHISMVIRLLPAMSLNDSLYLVPADTTKVSTSETKTLEERDLWTLYFPRHEQRLLGWLRARAPQASCHLKCLQLIKAICNLGGQALDSQGATLWRSVLSSYILKTAWLRLMLSTPPEAWEEQQMVARMDDLIRSLRDLLQRRAVAHLFLGGESSTSLLPDSVVLPKLVKEAMVVCHGNLGGNLWAGIPPASLDLVSGRLAYVWTHLHRLIRLSRPQSGVTGLRSSGHGHCQHHKMD